MTDSRVALGVDRLPWLPDEPKRAPPRAKARDAGSSNLVYLWAVLVMLLVAAASYWLGMRTAGDGDVPNASKPSATVDLPRAEENAPLVQAPPAPEVQPAPAPEVRPVPQPSLRISSPPARRLPRTVPPAVAERVKRTMATDEIDRVAAEQEKKQAPTGTKPVAAAPAPAAAKPAQPQKLTVWPARESAGASGRVVQIGAFGTRLQAKRGWTYMARAYPGVKKLPAVVVETRNSRGRRFYRFQIGTTSQAHSEVLCQRMQKIRFSCAVVGLPGQRRTVER